MKNIAAIVVMIPCLVLLAAEAPSKEIGLASMNLDVRVMTFNIRNGRARDGENHWKHRKEFVADVIRKYSPDMVGLQEAYRFQLDDLKQGLPEYAEVGVGRDGGVKGEYSAILYRTKRFELNETGTFWLSDTPTKPSAHWGNRYRRVCTWARLTDRKLARSLYIYNTHMDHQSQPAREKGARLIIKHIQQREHEVPFILMGDFNAGEDNPVVGFLKGTVEPAATSRIPVVDSWRVLHPDEKVAGTGSRFTGYRDGPKIDYIFVTPDTLTLEATIVRTSQDGRYPSDHYPVTAHLRIQQKKSVELTPSAGNKE